MASLLQQPELASGTDSVSSSPEAHAISGTGSLATNHQPLADHHHHHAYDYDLTKVKYPAVGLARTRPTRQVNQPDRFNPSGDNTFAETDAKLWQIYTGDRSRTYLDAKGYYRTAKAMIVERKIKLVTEQHNIPKPSPVEGFPMKEWNIEVYILDENGKEKPANCFTKVTYNLHPSFENPVQSQSLLPPLVIYNSVFADPQLAFHEPPFKCSNEGWGEFDLSVDCYTTEKGGKITVMHDLNFAQPTYENIQTVQFKNPSQALQAILRETGPLPSDEDRKGRKAGQDGAGGKKKKSFDVEKMADAITKLGEDDLMQVIQLIHDHKSDDTYILNNVEVRVHPPAGEFSVDLYTVPDALGKMLWDYILTTNQAHRLK
ncbi:uncharacterized protein E0L32_009366 [Thyridium curvatum]|uniref:YEATS domain-containing protein n=1 Tax=Thyridium curvatum TaxID=1093900 RepID=A0A507AXC6_9PEZI|nr:uncharacterized protein E0L32_009366 [Thyridium curvatum]TPX09478.1 hypothetical protein E0L32_009366 [Thyridium curvatum]